MQDLADYLSWVRATFSAIDYLLFIFVVSVQVSSSTGC